MKWKFMVGPFHVLKRRQKVDKYFVGKRRSKHPPPWAYLPLPKTSSLRGSGTLEGHKGGRGMNVEYS